MLRKLEFWNSGNNHAPRAGDIAVADAIVELASVAEAGAGGVAMPVVGPVAIDQLVIRGLGRKLRKIGKLFDVTSAG